MIERTELYNLTIGTYEDYSEVKENLEEMLNLSGEKYKVSKTAKSPPHSFTYFRNLNRARGLKNILRERYNIYKLVHGKLGSGTYWIKVE